MEEHPDPIVPEDGEGPSDSLPADASSSEVPAAELREVVLRIPGEHFFCETVEVPANLDPEDLLPFAEQCLREEGLSPFPVDQLAWGCHGQPEDGRIIIYGASQVKLRQLGWQNLEIFRRVLPSFISLFGKIFPKPTVAFLLHEETLTAAAFEANCSVPVKLFSLPLGEEEDEDGRFDETRGKLLSLFNLEKYDVETQVLATGDVERLSAGLFRFDHHAAGADPDDPPREVVEIGSDELWAGDVRSTSFKREEQDRREWTQRRWKAFAAWSVGVAAAVVAFVCLKIFEDKVKETEAAATAGREEVVRVLEAEKLLDKLGQNEKGGIDPMGSLVRLARYCGGQGDQPHLWFTFAHFPSSNQVLLAGEAKGSEAVTKFINNLSENKVARILKWDSRGTGGQNFDEFDVELELLEETQPVPSVAAKEGS